MKNLKNAVIFSILIFSLSFTCLQIFDTLKPNIDKVLLGYETPTIDELYISENLLSPNMKLRYNILNNEQITPDKKLEILLGIDKEFAQYYNTKSELFLKHLDKETQNKFQLANTLVLFLTFFVILWYTLETKDLKELQKEQIELSMRPILLIEKLFQNGQSSYFIKNIGNGVATNIEIKNFTINLGEFAKNGEEIKWIFELSGQKTLTKDSISKLELYQIFEDGRRDPIKDDSFFPLALGDTNNIKFEFEFEDIKNNTYKEIIEISYPNLNSHSEKINIISHKKINA